MENAIKCFFDDLMNFSGSDSIHSVLNSIKINGYDDQIAQNITDFLSMQLTDNSNIILSKYSRKLLITISQSNSNLFCNYFLININKIVNTFQYNISTKSSAKSMLNLLKWFRILLENDWDNLIQSHDHIDKILQYQAILFSKIVLSGSERYINKALRNVKNCWQKQPLIADRFFIQKKNSTIDDLLDALFLMNYLAIFSDSKIINKHRDWLIDTINQLVISSKNIPNSIFVQNLAPFLQTLSHSEFEIKLLPAIQKAILRNPETIMETIAVIIGSFGFDLSPNSVDLTKLIIKNLNSNNEWVRKNTIDCLKNVCEKCHNYENLQKVIQLIFDIFYGSDGKITVIEHKINVLRVVNNIVCNKIVWNEEFFNYVTVYFIKVMESEVNEKVLTFVLEMISIWCQTTQIFPKKLVKKILDCVTNVKTSSTLRSEYVHVLKQNEKFDKTKTIYSFSKDELKKYIEKQPNNLNQFYETLSLLDWFLQINEPGRVMFALIKLNKIITDEKVFSALSDNVLWLLANVCLKISIDPFDEINVIQRPIIWSILYGLIMRQNFSLNEHVFDNVLILKQSKNGIKTARLLVFEINYFIVKFNIISIKSDKIWRIITKLIDKFALFDNYDYKNKEMFLINSFLIYHYDQLRSEKWLKLFDKYDIKYEDFLKNRCDLLLEMLPLGYDIYETEFSQILKNCINSLIKLFNNHNLLAEKVLIWIYELEKSDLFYSTKEQYEIYLTPEDEIYDTSIYDIITNVEKTMLDVKNLKRESKVYSYKEQLEELQIKKELEAKKREQQLQNGNNNKTLFKDLKLNSKQQEILQQHKNKEQAIRLRMIEIKKRSDKIIAILDGLIQTDRIFVAIYLKDILFRVLPNLKSALIADDLVQFLLRLSQVAFNDLKWNHFGYMITYAILRIEKPQCLIKKRENWLEIDLEIFLNQILHTILINIIEITVPIYTFIFPIINYSMQSNNENLIIKALQVTLHFAQIKPFSNLEDDLWYSKHLPKYKMYETLINVIRDTKNPIHQSHAINCLLELAKNSNGEPDTVIITDKELNFLINQLYNDNFIVRDTIFRALIESNPLQIERTKDLRIKLIKWTFIGCHDIVSEVSQLANQFYTKINAELTPDKYVMLFDEILNGQECIQKAASNSLLTLITKYNNKIKIETILNKLISFYKEKINLIPAVTNDFGHIIEPEKDFYQPRLGVAICLETIAHIVRSEVEIAKLIKFYIKIAFNDRNEYVRQILLSAALRLVEEHGKDFVDTLLPQFEKFMDTAPKTAEFDNIRESVIILMGNLAKHLDKNDKRIKPIINKLITALSTPSETVQESVAECLYPLISSIKDDVPTLVQKLLQQLLKGDKYGERRGAAYGLAGIVKGMGIMSLKQYDIMTRLKHAIQDKKNYKQREGALFAFEILSKMLNRLFEPYVVHILPHLLTCFGDTSAHIRTAADETSRIVMSKLSAHGVKLVLPSLLQALNQDSWRTKTGSIELLGSMAYCAPKQLSSCLPNIVPKLIEVLSDSHEKVQSAAVTALKMIGSVIRNPEIQAIVPSLLNALEDPAQNTSLCLRTLLETKFIHFIDAPSLALIMPVVERAFKDRSSDIRKMSAQIIGNMYSLTNQKDFAPYLPNILPGLKDSLLDAGPEVRTVSARALGIIVRGIGDNNFDELLPWLMQMLTSETSSVNRSGAAQGLAEVVGGLGVEKLNSLMPEIILTAERNDIAAHVKDGYIMLFMYLPIVFNNDFIPYLSLIITPILKALADESEFVRETALKAGQRIVNQYADTCLTLFLPELEKGLFDDNWRIRYSSVQLLGDLLFKISGVSGKMTTETINDDDNFGTEQSHHAIIRILGLERRNKVLAGLYMGRSDVSLMVRQSALHVWKIVVTNTPKTLREILPTLFHLLLGCLASQSCDKRQVAARTLGDIVRKHGERVLPEMMPILERGLESNDPDQRQGVCVGLTEIMNATSKTMILIFSDSLIPTIQKALCDPLPEVRQAAAKTFDSLHSTLGSKILDDVLPLLIEKLNQINTDDSEYALDGLRQIIMVKSRMILPFLLPYLIKNPVNTKALAILATASGDALNRYLHKILPALLDAISTIVQTHNNKEFQQQMEYCQTLVLSVSDETGVNTLIDTLLEYTRNKDVDKRQAAVTLLCVYCTNTKTNYISYIPNLIRQLIYLTTESDPIILQMALDTLNAVTKTLDPKQQIKYVSDIRQAIRFALSDVKMQNNEKLLPGFCLPKGISPLLPIFREAILNAPTEDKESALHGLSEIIQATNVCGLQSTYAEIAGLLIRNLIERFTPNVRSGILDTLSVLMFKVGNLLKPFSPQLKSTILRCLIDSDSKQVRLKSAYALNRLIHIHTRSETIFVEVFNLIKTIDDTNIKETTILALRLIISDFGNKIDDTVKKQIVSYLIDVLYNSENTNLRLVSAGCLGALLKWLSLTQFQSTLHDHLLHESNRNIAPHFQNSLATMTVCFKESPQILWTEEYKDTIEKMLTSGLIFAKAEVVLSTIRCCAYLFNFMLNNDLILSKNLLSLFFKTMNHINNDVKMLIAKICTFLAKIFPNEKLSDDMLKLMLPALMNGTKEKNSYVKWNSEVALITVLHLRNEKDDGVLQRCLDLLEIGTRDSLNDVIAKVLKKVNTQQQHDDKINDFDETLVT